MVEWAAWRVIVPSSLSSELEVEVTELEELLRVVASSSQTMFPAAGVLVLLLYLLLLHELLTHLWGQDESTSHSNKGSGGGGGGGGGMYRPKSQTQQKRHHPHTLDALWRRMKQATDSFKVNGLKHALITTTMAEARVEARRIEQERLASTLAKD